ncbi:hypothetical protein BGZ59_006845 [Podila verticillata]|nr:hypothetical protein BGZ59_006845 [Podila verticillata]
MVQKANDKSTPGDYDYCVTVLSGGSMFPLSLSPISKEQILKEYPNIEVDPKGVFTPNKFCVQAPPVTAVIHDRKEAAQAPPVKAVINDRKMAASLRSSRRKHGA